MTIINRKHNFVYLKSRKTASSSIEIFLIRNTVLGGDIYTTSIEIMDFGMPRSQRQQSLLPGQSAVWYTPSSIDKMIRGRVRGLYRILPHLSQHDSAAQVRRLIGRKFFDSARKAVPVRNPWDALVSYYHWDISGGLGRKDPIQTTWDVWLKEKLTLRPELNDICDAQKFLFYDHVFQDGQPINANLLYFENIQSSLDELGRSLQLCFPKFDGSGMYFKKTKRMKDYRSQFSDEQAERVSRVFSDYLAHTKYRFDSVDRRPT